MKILVDVDLTMARAKLAMFMNQRRLVNIAVNVDNAAIARMIAGMANLRRQSNDTSNSILAGFRRANAGMQGFIRSFSVLNGRGMAFLRLAILLGPAVSAALLLATRAVFQMGSAFALVGGGIAVFGLAVRNVINHSKTAQAQVTRLKNAFNTFGLGSSHIIGKVLTNAVTALILVMKALEPAVRPIAKVFLDISKDIVTFLQGPATKQFSNWFKVAAPNAIRTFWQTAVLLIGGVITTLRKLGAFNGTGFLTWLRNTAAAFNTWANSGGPEKIRKFMDDWAPKLAQAAAGLFRLAMAIGGSLNPVLLIIVGWLGKFSMWLAKLIEQHPWLGQVIAGVIVGFKILGFLIPLISTAYRILTSNIFRNTMAWILNKAAIVGHKVAAAGSWLLGIITSLGRQTVSLVRNTAAWIANRVQIMLHRSTSIGSAILGVIGALGRQSVALIRNTAMWIANRAAQLGSVIAMTIARVAVIAFTAAQWLLNAALLANPFVFIAVLLIALGVALVLAYRRSETFRNIVQGAFNAVRTAALFLWNGIQIAFNFIWGIIRTVWNWVKNNWPLLVGIILLPFLGPLAIIGVLLFKFRGTVISIFNTISSVVRLSWQVMWAVLRSAALIGWTAIRAVFTVMRAVITAAFVVIRAIVLTTWTVMWAAIRGVVTIAVSAIRGTINVIRAVVVGVFNVVRAIAVGTWSVMWTAIRGILNVAWAAIQGTFNVMRAVVTGIFNVIRAVVTATWSVMWTAIRGAMNVAWAAIQGTFNVIRSVIAGIFNVIRAVAVGAWTVMWSIVRGVMNVAWAAIQGTFNVMRAIIIGIFRFIRALVTGDWQGMWNALRGIFNAAWSAIRGTFNVVRSTLASIWAAIRSAGERIWQAMWNAVRSIFNNAWSAVRNTFNVVSRTLSSIWTAIKDGTRSIWTAMWNAIRAIFNNAWSAIQGTFNVARRWMSALWTTVKDAARSIWTAMWNALKSIFNNAWSAIRGTFNVVKNTISSIFNTVKNTVSKIWQSAWDTIRSIFNDAWGRIRNSLNVMASTMKGIWDGIVKTAGKVWDGIKKAVGRPINFVIGFIVDRLIPLANTALKKVLGDKAPQINASGLRAFMIPGVATGGIINKGGIDRGYAAGGILPGYTPGRDIHIAQSPMGPIGLSGGEGILRPEVMRVPGMADFLHSANHSARHGGIPAVKNMMNRINNRHRGMESMERLKAIADMEGIPGRGFKNGGIVNGVRTVANFGDGGIFGDLVDTAKRVASVAVPGFGLAGAAMKKTDIMNKGFHILADKILGKIYNSALAWAGDMGFMGKIIGSVMEKAVRTIVEWVVGKTSGGGGDAGVGNALTKYTIWRQHIFYTKGGGNKKTYAQGGRMMEDRGNPTQNHFDHVHWSIADKPNLDNKIGKYGVVNYAQSTIEAIRKAYGLKTIYGYASKPGDHGRHKAVDFMCNTRQGNGINKELLTGKAGSGGGGGGKTSGKGLASYGSTFGGGGMAGGGKCFMTHFWDDFQPTASGRKMDSRTIASSYIPLGSKLTVGYKNKTLKGTIWDLGPAKFVYDRHPGIAVLDLATPMMKDLTGGTGNVFGTFKIDKVGTGRTLYGKRLRGYADGGFMQPGELALVGERGPELFQAGAHGGTVHPNTDVGGGPSVVFKNCSFFGANQKQLENVVVGVISDAERKGRISRRKG
jgi:phage-related protein